MTEREQLEQAIAHLEAQRGLLGNATVDAALAPMRQRLAELDRTAHGIARGPSAVDAPAGERKLVTVMFADLSGFTALAERYDPEAVREFVNRCFDRLVPVIEGFGGTVDKFIGDEIMALFGAPATHENDPERALRAALEMMSTLDSFNEEQGIDLGMHIGINTGLVIAGGLGSEGRQQYSVVGDAVNVAARLKDVAEGGTTLVGPDTFRGAKPLFEFEALESVHVKGKAEPVPVYRLLGFKATPDAVRGVEGLRSPLVGRDTEIGRLRTALRALNQGRGGVITVLGEAGLGKSRLVAEARVACRGGPTWAEGRALSYAQDDSYGVAREVLLGLFAVSPDTPPDELTNTLLGRIRQLLPQESAEVYPYLAHLLDLPLDEMTASSVTRLQPQALQTRILSAYSRYVAACACENPLVLVWEDLHWADPSSLNLLEALLPLCADVPLLLLLVLRPEGERIQSFFQRLRESLGEDFQSIELQPLNLRESAQLVRNLLEVENLPEEVRRLILDKVEGNPFFLEEVLRSLLDAGLVVFEGNRAVAAQPIQTIDVPETLYAVIAARIDRLAPSDKQTLQTASVIGRVFQRRVLAEMARRRIAGNLETSLSELCRREFIRLRGMGEEEREYIFKHVITQDVTYNSLLLAQRKALHRVAGEAIETLFPDQLDELAAMLAYHFEQADVCEKALAYLRRAGEKAMRLSANEEAIAHFRKALNILAATPASRERDEQEVSLLLALATPLSAVRGWGVAEWEPLLDRSRELSRRIEDGEHLFHTFQMLSSFHGMRGDYRAAIQFAEENLGVARRLDDPLKTMNASWALGYHLLAVGDFVGALDRLEQALGFYDLETHGPLVFQYGMDAGTYCNNWAAYALWFLGYPDRARKRNRESLARARELDHPGNLAFALSLAGTDFNVLSGNPGEAQENCETAIRLTTEEGFVLFNAFALFARGHLLTLAGRVEEGIEEMQRASHRFAAMGTKGWSTRNSALLAGAFGRADRYEEGLGTIAEALQYAQSSGERYYEAELRRLEGELLMKRSGADAEAEACFCQAIDVSRRQQARLCELRATTSLGRLWEKQGRQKQARRQLAEIYGWFTEGFDTPDLKEAKALLDELGA